MKFKINIKFVLILLLLSLYPVLGRDLSWTVAFGKMDVQMHAWIPDGDSNFSGVLLLVPGYNGAGELMLDERWRKVAELNHLVLLAPSFFAEGHENNYGKGYYYPEQGSGLVIEKALDDLHQRTAVHTEKVFFFGFSAGAHFVHRFALWRPNRVKAFVAYSAGWWDGPNESMKKIPALIMCGEDDERYEATFNFFKKGQKMDCPWIWRSYPNTGHVLTSEVRDMAEAFLADQIAPAETGKEVKRYGDIQTFQCVPEVDKETIPEECRICLPSVKMAEAWEKEALKPMVTNMNIKPQNCLPEIPVSTYFFAFLLLMATAAIAQTPSAEKKLPEGVVSFTVKTRSAMNKEVPFYLRVPKGYQKKEGQSCRLFFLCPHVNADGLYVMGNSSYWYAIADQRQWFILAPTFKQTKEQVLDRKESYYYPESFSGRAVLDALDIVAKNYQVDTQRIFMQGFSGGAQFVHRFALWAPDRVTAVAVNSSSWLDDPNPKCTQTVWLVSIGESDETYDHTLKFVDGLRQMGAAPLFRSYLGMIHEKSGNVERRLNTAFFQFYDDQTKDQLGKPRSTLSVDPHQQAMKGSAMPFVGDMQCWKYVANTEENREEIPEDSRVYLPSEGLAKIWGSKEVEEDQ